MVRRDPGGVLLVSGWSDKIDRICLSIPLALILIFWGMWGSVPVKADIGVMLSDPTGDGSSRFTEAGHSSIYLSNVCPVSPVRLRLCRPGEQGSVISNYSRLGEDKPYEWNIVPLSIFLYGFNDPSERPLVASLLLKRSLEEQYRRNYLGELCAGPPCSTDLNLNWRDMVATTFIRGMYLFAVHTTLNQDRKFVQDFNSRENVNHYNGISNNCADFARRVIAEYFTHATSPDYLNDFGMTSPKAVARSFTHYAERRPALGLYIRRYAQMPSDRKLTGDARAGTDAMLHQKKWVLPLLILRGYELPIVGATYALTGRFNPATEEKKYPYRESVAAAPENQQRGLRSRTDNLPDRRLSSVLTPDQEWQQYKERFAGVLEDAQRCGTETTHKKLNELLEDANRHGSFFVDEQGKNWMTLRYDNQEVRVGVESGNALDEESDPKLAFALQLAKIDRYLRSKAKKRESLREFESDWALLERLRTATVQGNPIQKAIWQKEATAPELPSGGSIRDTEPSAF